MGILEGIASDPARAHQGANKRTQPRHLTGDVSETGVVRVESFGLLGTPGDFSRSPMPWDCSHHISIACKTSQTLQKPEQILLP